MKGNVFLVDQPSDDGTIVKARFVDPCQQYDYLDRFYLRSFIAEGGSKLKLLIGREGSGKTHLLRRVLEGAKEAGYITVLTTPKDSPLYSFQEVYSQVLSGVSIQDIVRSYVRTLVREMGYEDYPNGDDELDFVQWATGQGYDRRELQQEIKKQLQDDLLRDRNLDRTFATALMTMCRYFLGLADTHSDDMSVVTDWISGRPVMARDRNRVHLYRAVNRYNSRLMLRSFLRFIPRAGFRGVVLAVDDLDWIIRPTREGGVNYTKLRRDELYESFRQLIDEVETLPGLMVLLSGRRELLDDAARGIPSYAALWMRLQNEVRSTRVNRFADLIDLDQLWDQAGPKSITEIAERLISELNSGPSIRDSVIKMVQQLDRGGRISPVKRAIELTLGAGNMKRGGGNA